jgi:fructuronate reductase/mannitol 2-dehydrogenase
MNTPSRPAAHTAVRLTDPTLDRVAPHVAAPTYDRASLRAGVVHIGVGQFHRAHQEVYFDELARRGVTDWGVVGVGLHSRTAQDALEPQDLLYTVVERDADADTARVVGSLLAHLHAPADPDAVLAVLADPRIRVVTMTVTGAGYHLEPSSGAFDAEDPEVRADLDHPDAPTTFFGFVAAALARRRRDGTPPFTVLSCDNIPNNGAAARRAVVGFARLRDEELAAWIEEHVAFPSSMVDRITPSADEDDVALVEREFGVEDRRPVVTERFRQWIVEDRFCAGRPPLEDVGVQFVDDVAPYELMKKRLLNGGHCALGYLGSLAGHRTTDEAMQDPAFSGYLRLLMHREIVPLLPSVPGVDLDDYVQTLHERLSNPKIKDELGRLGRRGSTKVPSYLLPSIADARRAGRPHDLLTLAVAGWLRYLRGTGFAGEEIVIEDARKDVLQPLAAKGGSDPRPVLSRQDVFGDLGADEGFVAQLEEALAALDADGPRATIQAFVDGLQDGAALEAA